MSLRIRIRKHQFGLWFRHGDFYRLLEAGAYFVPGRMLGRDAVEVVDTRSPKFEHQQLDTLVREPALAARLQVLDLAGDERALVWRNGRLDSILGSGLHAYWLIESRRPSELQIESFDLGDSHQLRHAKIDEVLEHREFDTYFEPVKVEPHERVLVYRNGDLDQVATPGVYAFWRRGHAIQRTLVDLREQIADVAGQEIMTKDKVTLRINLMVTYRVTDPVIASSVVTDYSQALYREAQLVLRSAVGTRPLENLLSEKNALGKELELALAERALEFGVEVRSVGLRDIVLPGEMKNILNQVIEAQKTAEANLIRRREETAAARSQANTAKLLAENPVLARMKELEQLQEILRGAETTFVLGNQDLLTQLRGVTNAAG